MPHEKVERNNFIVKLFEAGKTATEIQKLLIEAGYGEISRWRIWSIYKASGNYKSLRKEKSMFCAFCLENKNLSVLYHIKKIGKYKIHYRICQDCIDKYLPTQPISV